MRKIHEGGETVTKLKLLVTLVAVGAFAWGCIEELSSGKNSKPNVWFTAGPEDGAVIFQNSVEFEWMATDFDDDLGMGKMFVRLDPSYVEWVDVLTGSLKVYTHPEGWQRVYERRYEIIDLPDTSFIFAVRVIDGRGADSTVTTGFIVRFDNLPPVIDSVTCPPAKIAPQQYDLKIEIFAHDIARSPRSATPVDSLEFSYKLVGPRGSGFRTVESQPEWSPANRVFTYQIDGQTYQGKGQFTFRYKVRDRAMNTSPELVCKFEFVQ